MEITSRNDEVVIGTYGGVVSCCVDFDICDRLYIAYRVLHGTMHLRYTTEGIGVLHMLLGLLDEFASFEDMADVFGCIHLALVRTHFVDGTMEWFDTSVVGIKREGTNVVGPVA